VKIILSRTDSIGDVILSLPMAGLLKQAHPDCHILFLGRTYTEPVIKRSVHVDEFLNWDVIAKDKNPLEADTIIHVFPNKQIARLAKKSKITTRIGTSHRHFHWFSCNKLVNLGRRESTLHEAQLNLKLLGAWGINADLALNQIPELYGWKTKPPTPTAYSGLLDSQKFNLIFHMKSKGSAKEWPGDNYHQLAKKLGEKDFNIMISGTEEDGEKIKAECPEIFNLSHIKDITGKFNLEEFITFIENTDGILAASTGPLHIAAAAEKYALGLYPFEPPIHAGRWAPVGIKASYLSEKKSSNHNYLNISIKEVEELILQWA